MLKFRFKNLLLSIFVFSTGWLSAQSQVSKERAPEITKPSNIQQRAGSFIDVNVPPYAQSNWTITQLVKDVLITGGSNCSTPDVTNVTVSPNTAVTDPERTWGYFNKGTTSFPFNDGIVLVTGKANEAGNAQISTTLSGGPTTPSDPDLVAAINPLGSLNNTTAIEFDFVPTAANVQFRYLFASEEYTSSFPCGNFSDGFALLIKPVGGAYTNLAVLPGGAGPVSVTNIVPSSFSCGPINAAFFAGLNPTPNIETNFNGRTIPLTAQTTVTPGQAYHFKMIIADAVDTAYNSGVFLEGGSFNIGVQILGPTGVVLPSQVQMCNNAPQTLTASITTPGATYQWFLNGTLIPGATSSTYIANQPGTYSIQVTIPGNNCPGTAQVEIIGGTSPAVQDVTLTQCYGAGNVNFNLTLVQPTITSVPGVTFQYYLNQADAQAGNNNTIANPSSFSSAGNQTVYASVKSGFCRSVAAITLVKAPEMIATIAQPQAITCTTPQIVLNANGSVVPAGATVNWVATAGGYIVSGANTLSPIVNTGGTYTLNIIKTYQPGDTTCSVSSSVTVLQDNTPPVATVTSTDNKICVGQSVTLTATGGITYEWINNSTTGNTITVSPTTTTTYQVFAIGANGCKSVTPATVTITVIPAIVSILPEISGQICPTDKITLDAGPGPNYTYLWNTGATTQTIETDVPGDYTVIISNGECSKEFKTKVILAQIPKIINVAFANNVMTLTASNPSNGVLEYSIDNGFTWQDSNVFNNVPSNVYLTIYVRVKTTSCVGRLDYFTFFFQNVITPNGDGINDYMDLTGISQYKNFSASVYDRYGKELWKGDKVNPMWNGRFQGRVLPTASYWYNIQYEDPASKENKSHSGWILLKNRD